MVEQTAPAQGGGESSPGSDIAEAIASLTANEQVPDEAKAAFQASLDAFRAGMEILQGGGAAQAPQASGPVTMQQGASGAAPMNHGGPRG